MHRFVQLVNNVPNASNAVLPLELRRFQCTVSDDNGDEEPLQMALRREFLDHLGVNFT